MTSMLMFFQSIPVQADYPHMESPVAGDLVYFGARLDLTELKVWDGTAWVDANLNWLEVHPVKS
jgi:hypothetical protein